MDINKMNRYKKNGGGFLPSAHPAPRYASPLPQSSKNSLVKELRRRQPLNCPLLLYSSIKIRNLTSSSNLRFFLNHSLLLF